MTPLPSFFSPKKIQIIGVVSLSSYFKKAKFQKSGLNYHQTSNLGYYFNIFLQIFITIKKGFSLIFLKIFQANLLKT